MRLPFEEPWPKPDRAACHFYHAFDLPDGENVPGIEWDLRGLFPQYVGQVAMAGKSVLDVGTASGFLAFEAERAGATVTAIDCRDALDRDDVPFAGNGRLGDFAAWHERANAELSRLKNSFWYVWHARSSRVRVAYMPLRDLGRIDERFDIVIGGAIIEHLADPVTALGAFCRAARETVVLPYTLLTRWPGLSMQTMNPWRQPAVDYVWWRLSRRLMAAVFANMGFEMELKPCRAICTIGGARTELRRQTIVAHRKSDLPLPRPARLLERFGL